MQIQSVDTAKSNVRFKSNKAVEKASAFVNLDDNQLKDLAYVMSYDKDSQKKKNKTLLSMFYAMPVVDVIASGILVEKSAFGRKYIAKLSQNKANTPDLIAEKLNQAKLGLRLKSAGSTAGIWAVGLSVIGVYNAVKKAVVSKSDNLKNFQKDNPVSSFILDIGAIFAGFALALKGLGRLEEKFPKGKAEINANIDKTLSDLNKTRFNKELLPKLSEGVARLSTKAPLLVNAGRFALANSVWIMFGAGLLKSLNNQTHDQKSIEKNYTKLKVSQLKTAKQLNRKLEAEKLVLLKNQSELIEELSHQKKKVRLLKAEVQKREETNSEISSDEV